MTIPKETKINLNSYTYALYLSQGVECDTTNVFQVSDILQFIPPTFS